jgi:hypothetical protein
MIPMMLDNVTQGELTRYENNYNPLNLITTVLGMNVYDRVIHLETAHDVCLKLCNTYEDSSESKSSHKDTYNRQYQTFSQKTGESLDDYFARFESIVSSFSSCVLLAVIKCTYLPPTYLHFIQDIEDRCLLLMSSTSFIDLPFQEHRMMEKHHMDQNPCISSLFPNKA